MGNKTAQSNGGSWETLTYEQIDLRDSAPHEIYVTGSEKLEIPAEKRRDPKRTHCERFMGIERDVGPVAFLANDDLEKNLIKAGLPGIYRIVWRGLKKLKDGKQFNVYQVDRWNGDLPEWTRKKETVTIPNGALGDSEFPE
jgi:hypothetical protein